MMKQQTTRFITMIPRVVMKSFVRDGLYYWSKLGIHNRFYYYYDNKIPARTQIQYNSGYCDYYKLTPKVGYLRDGLPIIFI